MTFAATVDFEVHLEVWLLILGAVGLGWYTSKVLQPKAVAAGYAPLARYQRVSFALGVILMWIVSDWPVHEIAESRLYFVHMFQHLFLSMVVPALFVLSTPRWLFELLLPPDSRLWSLLKTGSKPIVAGVIFNALTLVLHWPTLVQLSFDSGAVHFALHLMVFVSGLLMWMPVVGPVSDWRLSPLGQCCYLFSMSIVPTVPGGWLVFAEDVVYRHYDTPERLWGIGVLTDQQAAGVVMKLVGGFLLWAMIFVIFMRWANREMRADEQARQDRVAQLRSAREASESVDLTFDRIQAEFARTPAPVDPSAD